MQMSLVLCEGQKTGVLVCVVVLDSVRIAWIKCNICDKVAADARKENCIQDLVEIYILMSLVSLYCHLRDDLGLGHLIVH